MARPAKSSPRLPPPVAASLPLERRLAYALTFALAVALPFVIWPSSLGFVQRQWPTLSQLHEPFRLPKLVAAEILTLGSVLMLAIAWARNRLPEPPRATLLAVTLVLAPILAVASLGLLFGAHPEHLHQALVALAVGVTGCAAWTLGFDRERLERLLGWSVVPAVGLALVGIGQFHFPRLFQPFSFQQPLVEGSRLAVTSLAGNAGELGGYLLLPAMVAQWRMLAEPGRRRLWGAALAVLVYGQIASQTLTALAALAVGGALFWLLALPSRRRGLVLGVTVAATLVMVLAAPPVRERLAKITDGVSAGRLNAALSGRLDGWRVASHLFAEHPFLGVGLGGFAPEFAPAKLTLAERGVQFFPGHREPFFANAHNEFLEWAAEGGVLGLAALGWALWTLLRGLRRLAPGSVDRAFAVAVLVSLALLAVAYFPFRLPLLAYPILLFLAWLLRATTEGISEGTP